MEDELLFYLDEYYLLWLKASWSYHFDNSGHAEIYMGDSLWDGLAKGYADNLQRYPYLKSINFDGSTMGVGVSEEGLLKEIDRVEKLK